MRQSWTRVLTVLFVAALVATAGAQAREAFPSADRSPFEDLASSMESTLPDPGQLLPGEQVPPALALTVAYLELDEAQVAELIFLLQERKQAVAPIAAQILQLEQTLEQLLMTPEPPPAAIGNLVLQIRQRKIEIRGLRMDFVDNFEHELDDEQLQKLRRADKAKQLQPVIKALDAIGLI